MKALEIASAYIAASGDYIFTQMLITHRRKLPKSSGANNNLAVHTKEWLKGYYGYCFSSFLRFELHSDEFRANGKNFINGSQLITKMGYYSGYRH